MENTPLKLVCFVFPIAGFQCHAIQIDLKKSKPFNEGLNGVVAFTVIG